MRNRLFLLLSAIAVSSAMLLSGSASAQNIIHPEVKTGFLVGPIGGINLVRI